MTDRTFLVQRGSRRTWVRVSADGAKTHVRFEEGGRWVLDPAALGLLLGEDGAVTEVSSE